MSIPVNTRSRKEFYRVVLSITVPVLIQSIVTNTVNLLDNVMVGRIGELSMSGVTIANNLFNVFNISVFGASSGAGIFAAQFYGKGDHDGVRSTFRYKVLVLSVLSLVACGLFWLWGEPLVGLYLKGEGSAADAAATLDYGLDYLRLMLLGLLPMALANAYSTTLRECGQTTVPMVGGLAAVFTNLFFNWVLIFGNLGAPALGVKGAAIATVLSRFVELGVVALWTHLHSERCPFIRGAWRSFRIPGRLLGQLLRKGSVLFANETLYALGMASVSQSYSLCALAVMPAINIATTMRGLCSVGQSAMAQAVSIIMGQLLGSGASREDVKRGNRRVLRITVLVSAAFALLLAASAPFFPRIYAVSPEVRRLSVWLILILAVQMPMDAYGMACYYTLRSGGKLGITMLFDCGYVLGLVTPLAFVLTRFTSLTILPIYALTSAVVVARVIAGFILVRTDVWIRNLTEG